MKLAIALGTLACIAFAAAPIGNAATPDAPSAPPGFRVERIANVPDARELAVTPNGDLLVGTSSATVEIVADAESTPRLPSVFVHLDDERAAGLALARDALYVGATFGVWKVPYVPGERLASASPERIFAVRTGGAGGHSTTSLALSRTRLFAAIGSSCNACTETDPTRATIQTLATNGTGAKARAVGIRNAVALGTDPATGDLWAGVAGQDELQHGHPYEIFDDVGARSGTPDYGWPTCYENHRAARDGADCSREAVPSAVFPAYETPIGIAFYPPDVRGRYAFPTRWRGGAFVTLHGSWHRPLVAPLVAFVPIDGNKPTIPVDWNDPSAQWKPFLDVWQDARGDRIGRPTGIAVGNDGSLFVADDETGAIYRIRPVTP